MSTFNDIGIFQNLDWNRIHKLFIIGLIGGCVRYKYSDRVDGEYCHDKLINLSH